MLFKPAQEKFTEENVIDVEILNNKIFKLSEKVCIKLTCQHQFSFYLGNENIHLLTSSSKHELRVDLRTFSGKKAYAKYSIFSVASEADKDMLTVGGYSGNAGNRMFSYSIKKIG